MRIYRHGSREVMKHETNAISIATYEAKWLTLAKTDLRPDMQYMSRGTSTRANTAVQTLHSTSDENIAEETHFLD